MCLLELARTAHQFSSAWHCSLSCGGQHTLVLGPWVLSGLRCCISLSAATGGAASLRPFTMGAAHVIMKKRAGGTGRSRKPIKQGTTHSLAVSSTAAPTPQACPQFPPTCHCHAPCRSHIHFVCYIHCLAFVVFFGQYIGPCTLTNHIFSGTVYSAKHSMRFLPGKVQVPYSP